MKRRHAPALASLLIASAIAAAMTGTCPEASARVVAGDTSDDTPDTEQSLRSRLGVTAALALTASTKQSERIRGLERLGSTGTPRAVAQLVRALSPGGTAASPAERLTAVRELAFSDDPGARRALAFVLGGHLSTGSSGDSGEPHPLDLLAEGTAALALARAATPDAASTLGKALGTGGRSSAHAVNALLAYPPRDLGAVLKSAPVPSVALATLLGDLGDQRALAPLRDLVRRATAPVRAAAAVSLTKLGDYEAIPLARKWSTSGEQPALRVAAATILVLARDAGATRAVSDLLGDGDTAAEGLALAASNPDPKLLPRLVERARGEDWNLAFASVAVIGACNHTDAVKALEALLPDPVLGSRAAEALARSTAESAGPAIDRALRQDGSRRNAARAAAARFFLLGERSAGAASVFAALARSAAAADRAVAAQGKGLYDADQIWPHLWSKDTAVSSAASSLLLVAPSGVADTLAANLNGAPPAWALALAAAAPHAAPTGALVARVDARDMATPLAVSALAARDEARLRPMTTAWLASPDTVLRLHAASGLGNSREPDATGRLAARYRLEPDTEVRAAIVRALSRRPDGSGKRTLALAAALDPDVTTRTSARLGLSGTAVSEPTRGDALVWIHTPAPGAPSKPARQAVPATRPAPLTRPMPLTPLAPP